MSRRSKREVAPPPPEADARLSWSAMPPPPVIPGPYPPGTWLFPPPPPQGVPISSAPRWFAAPQQQPMPSSSAPSTWWPQNGPSPSSTVEKVDSNSDLQEWEMNPRPPNGFLSYFNNQSTPAQHVTKESQSGPINVDNDGDAERTEKRLAWTQEEDLRLVSAWLNNSNDPIHGNYKKNEQYWGDVTAVYNSTTPKKRAQLAKQIKDRFAKIKKKVGWFCCSWKEANSIYVSGQNEVQLIEKALKIYEEDYKDGQFMFMYCWKVLCNQPKWYAYLEDLDQSKKRKFDDGVELEKNKPSPDNVEDLERPIGSKAAKAQRKYKGKDKKTCISEIEDDLHRFLDAKTTTKEDRSEMLETQKRVSSENLEAKRLAHLAATENKKAAMLETYRAFMMLDTSAMPDDLRSEHVLALKCMREELFGKSD